MRSATINNLRCVFARVTAGKTEASTARRPSIPSTRHSGSTTVVAAAGSPMRQVPTTWAVSRATARAQWPRSVPARRRSTSRPPASNTDATLERSDGCRRIRRARRRPRSGSVDSGVVTRGSGRRTLHALAAAVGRAVPDRRSGLADGDVCGVQQRERLWRALKRLSGRHAGIGSEDLRHLARGQIRGRPDPADRVKVTKCGLGVWRSGVRGARLGSGDMVRAGERRNETGGLRGVRREP